MVFLPKGKEEGHLQAGAYREAARTRALALKNADNKIVDAAVNQSIKRELAIKSPGAQRGFLMGRNFLNNITLLDTFGRAAGSQDRREVRQPYLALFDFGDAFPSLAHGWLELTLQRAGMAVPSSTWSWDSTSSRLPTSSRQASCTSSSRRHQALHKGARYLASSGPSG